MLEYQLKRDEDDVDAKDKADPPPIDDDDVGSGVVAEDDGEGHGGGGLMADCCWTPRDVVVVRLREGWVFWSSSSFASVPTSSAAEEGGGVPVPVPAALETPGVVGDEDDEFAARTSRLSRNSPKLLVRFMVILICNHVVT